MREVEGPDSWGEWEESGKVDFMNVSSCAKKNGARGKTLEYSVLAINLNSNHLKIMKRRSFVQRSVVVATTAAFTVGLASVAGAAGESSDTTTACLAPAAGFQCDTHPVSGVWSCKVKNAAGTECKVNCVTQGVVGDPNANPPIPAKPPELDPNGPKC